MTPEATSFVQELFRDTVRRLNELHTYTVEANPTDIRALHQIWEALDRYQLDLTQVIRTHIQSSPHE